MNDRHTITLAFADNDLARQLFGEHNSHLQRLAEILDVRVNARGTTLFVEGERPLAELAENLLNQLYGLLREGYPLHPNDIEYAARMLSGSVPPMTLSTTTSAPRRSVAW
jgi:phosphate starvation-inducible PhoH-like protein